MRLCVRLFVLSLLPSVLLCSFLTDHVYVDIKGLGACFRRFNATHQIGCATPRGGNVGLLLYLNSTEKWADLKTQQGPFIVLLEHGLFTKEALETLAASGKVNGLLVAHRPSVSLPANFSFSPEQTCPNQHVSIYSPPCFPFNLEGNGLLFRDMPFPIYTLTDADEIQRIVDCVPGPMGRCALQVKAEMYGAVNSEVCLRRSSLSQNSLTPATFCDALQGENVWGTMQNLSQAMNRTKQSVVLLLSRTDAASLFEGLALGAEVALSPMITLLAAAEAIGKMQSLVTLSPKDVMFAFVQGEAFDAIGSSRMAWDMAQKTFSSGANNAAKVTLESLDIALAVDMLGASDSLWLHANDDVSTQLVQQVETAALALGVSSNRSNSSLPLPPSPVLEFIRQLPSLPAVVLSDFDTRYSTKFAASRLDVAAQLSDNQTIAKRLWRAASVVATTTLRHVSNNFSLQVEANLDTVQQLVECFMSNPNCTLLQFLLNKGEGDLPTDPFDLYVGVRQEPAKTVVQLIRRLLAVYIGQRSEANTDLTCNKTGSPFVDVRVNTSTCFSALVTSALVRSPAFEGDVGDADWNKYSTWTESVWDPSGLQVQLFLQAYQGLDAAVFAAGTSLLFLSGILVCMVERRTRMLFPTEL